MGVNQDAVAGTALVTGGTRGIGRAIVDALVHDGWQVGFTFHRGEAQARAIESEHGDRARAFHLDLTDAARPDALVREVEAALGPLAALVNSAGIRHDGLLASTPDREWQAVIDTNAAGAFRTCRAVLPGMVTRRHGVIINISSLAAVQGAPGQGAYAASKAALVGMSRSLAREVGKRNVRVNVVVPGFVETDMTAGLAEPVRQALRSRECLPGGIQPRDVAYLVAFLVSPRAAAVTGQVIAVDAGSSA